MLFFLNIGLKLDYAFFNQKIKVFIVLFEIFKRNDNYNSYGFNHFLIKERKKVGDLHSLAKAITIYFNKKTKFNNKNNDGSNKLA